MVTTMVVWKILESICWTNAEDLPNIGQDWEIKMEELFEKMRVSKE